MTKGTVQVRGHSPRTSERHWLLPGAVAPDKRNYMGPPGPSRTSAAPHQPGGTTEAGFQ